jgi:hypothetical protein
MLHTDLLYATHRLTLCYTPTYFMLHTNLLYICRSLPHCAVLARTLASQFDKLELLLLYNALWTVESLQTLG